MAVHTHLIAGVLIVAMASLGTVFADFCQEREDRYLGDLNRDGIIDMEDMRHFAQYDLGRARGFVPDPRIADIDLDGSIKGGDLVLLIKGAQRRQGVAFDLRQLVFSSNPYMCIPDPDLCVGPLPRARVEARLEGNIVSRTMTDDLGHAYLLLPPGTFDIVIYPPDSGIDATLTAIQVPAGLRTIQPPPYKAEFAPGELLVGYDVADEDRLQEIFADLGVTSSVPTYYPGIAFLTAFLPDCLHVMEAIEALRTYPEIRYADPNWFIYTQ